LILHRSESVRCTAVEIEGEFYWDGGLVSNTPLRCVLESDPRRDTLAFQVDLGSARGTLPRTMLEVMTRQKEIQYSSRTRNNSDRFKSVQRPRNALASLLEKLPDEPIATWRQPISPHETLHQRLAGSSRPRADVESTCLQLPHGDANEYA